MPRGNRTGPLWEGARTGRRAGECAGHDVPGYLNENVPPLRLGRRRGRRGGPMMGRGRGGRPPRGMGEPSIVPVTVVPPAAPTEEEVSFLEAYAREVMEDLTALRARIDQLKGADDQAED